MKVLVIGRNSWDNSNCFGNTMSNFFSNWNQNDIAYLYCKASKPNNSICKKYFSISDFDIVKSFFNWNYTPGVFFHWNLIPTIPSKTLLETKEEKIYNFFRTRARTAALIFQEVIWLLGWKKNLKLENFLTSFSPDIIFATSFNSLYLFRLLNYAKRNTGAKVVLFHDDDRISKYKCWYFLFAPYGFLIAKANLVNIKSADFNYCISHKMQEEYEKITGKKMGILYKGSDFSIAPLFKAPKNVMKIVYAGTIHYGRWRTLSMLANSINKINNEKTSFELKIYSQHQPTEKALNAMTINGCSKYMGKLPSDQVPVVLKEADIVLHVESFNEKEKITTRLSFSTKIVDCFKSGSCVMAIGWQEAASIDYLIKNDAAIVATNEEEIIKQLKIIAYNPLIITKYAKKAWECGKRNHKIDEIQNRLYADLESLVKEYSC